MRDVLTDIMKWWDAGETFGLATVVRTFRSAPREPGAALAVSTDGGVVGSVSGGCVEGAVYELCGEAVSSGRPVLQTYGVSDDDAFAVGLTCGGILDVFVEPVSRELFPDLGDLAAAVQREEPVAVATVISGPGEVGARRVIYADGVTSGTLGAGDRLDEAVDDDARGMLAQGQTAIRRYGTRGERRHDELAVFVNSFAPPPRMMVFGAIDFAAAVARVGKFLGYRVTVCDARGVFATTARFRDADEVIVEWPHRYLADADVDERTVICVLTHDPKFDVPLLEVALRTPAGYIGAMGSRRTHEDRLARLREAGLTDAELSRLRSPIGLDLGARDPQETAVSIAAELIQLRWGGSGRPFTSTDGRIHPVTAARELTRQLRGQDLSPGSDRPDESHLPLAGHQIRVPGPAGIARPRASIGSASPGPRVPPGPARPSAPRPRARVDNRQHRAARPAARSGQSFRPETARVAPMPIMTRPPVPPISSSRRGDRPNDARADPAAIAHALSDSNATPANTAPSNSSCCGMCPACRSTNCGSTAAKNTIAFGLPMPTMNPSLTRRARLLFSIRDPSASASRRRCRIA